VALNLVSGNEVFRDKLRKKLEASGGVEALAQVARAHETPMLARVALKKNAAAAAAAAAAGLADQDNNAGLAVRALPRSWKLSECILMGIAIIVSSFARASVADL
jgi:hypothetical protein